MERQVLTSMTEEEFNNVVYKAISKFWLENLPKKESPVNELKYITKKEAAKILRIGMTKLNELTRSGAIKSYRIGCNVRLVEQEVLGSLNKVEPASRK